ncbi:hypothetical protein L6452_14490 [Arctium lappa]|uniref:Uncharacterized protein n=1 Tax=Arctium lappa TaxID=4217 RepID=A0ACB9CL65_ARCLA|nr:hypothetical protein L6452_14490 [Arctium lappa]
MRPYRYVNLPLPIFYHFHLGWWWSAESQVLQQDFVQSIHSCQVEQLSDVNLIRIYYFIICASFTSHILPPRNDVPVLEDADSTK